MNNEEKNTYMRIQMTAALLDLMKKKPAFEIFISELTERAKIGRVSFYRNYHSKGDILKQVSESGDKI